MAEQYYAIVFTRDFAPGDHWTDHLPTRKPGEKFAHGKHRADDDDSDRRQHWRAGDLYSIGTVVGSLPDHLESIPIDGPQPAGHRWNHSTRSFEPMPIDAGDVEHQNMAAKLRASGWSVTPPAHG